MDRARVIGSLLLLVCVTAALASTASAQQGPVLPGTAPGQLAAVASVGDGLNPAQFGSEWFTKVIPVTAFTGRSSSDTWATAGNGYIRAAAGGSFQAPLDLPPGVEVEQVCLFVLDSSTTGSALMSWSVVRMGDSTQGPGVTLIDSAASGTPQATGYQVICATTGTPVPIRALADVDGDGDTEYNWHYIAVSAPVDPGIAWGGATVKWRRAISPAPATATFPNDVPTTHSFFREIEALAASKVTLGCAVGSYCPDQPVTRAQMAAFFARALGLYWPD